MMCFSWLERDGQIEVGSVKLACLVIEIGLSKKRWATAVDY